MAMARPRPLSEPKTPQLELLEREWRTSSRFLAALQDARAAARDTAAKSASSGITVAAVKSGFRDAAHGRCTHDI